MDFDEDNAGNNAGPDNVLNHGPAHTPLQTEVRVDSCVLAPYRPGYFISARVEKVLPYTDEYLIKELMKADDIRANPRKVKRDQLQVVFSAWCSK